MPRSQHHHPARFSVALVGAIVAVAFTPSSAFAQTRAEGLRATFAWQSALECVDDDEIARRVGVLLGRDALVLDASPTELHLDGRLEPATEGQYRLFLQLTTTAGAAVGTSDRTLEEADCAELIDLVSVILGVMLNVRPEDIPPPPADDVAWRVRVGASVAGLVGLLPQPGIETALSITAEARRSVILGAEISFDWADEVAAGSGSASILSATARVVLGYAVVSDEVELVPHVAAGGGAIWVTGRGFDANHIVVGGIVDLRAGLRFGLHVIGPLWFAARAEVGFLPILPTFDTIEAGVVTLRYEPLPVFGAFGGGLALHLD